MADESTERFLRALLRSAAADAASPGARGRALVRLEEDARSAWATSRCVCNALLLVVAVIVPTLRSGALGTSELGAQSSSASSVPAAVTRGASAPSCGGEVEAPSDSCGGVGGGKSRGGSSESGGGSSGGAGIGMPSSSG